MQINRKTLRSIFLCVAGCILLYWLLHETERLTNVLKVIGRVFSPFFVGAAIAFVLNVPLRGIEKLLRGIKKAGLRRGIAIVLTMLSVLLVLFAVVQLLVPQLVLTVESIVAELPGFFNRVQAGITDFLNNNPQVMDWVMQYTDFGDMDWSKLIQESVTLVGNSASVIINGLFTAVGSVSNGVFNAVLSLVFAIYCLSRKEILARQGRRIIYSFLPERVCDESVRILRLTNATFSNFISGQCLEALILGSMFAISMSIFGFPYIPLISVIIAVTALVPIVGAFAGCILGALFILVVNPVQAFWFVIMFLILQQIEGNLIYPRVVGTSIGLPGMWVLVAVAVGGDLMGVGGMLLMIPIASVAYALLREVTTKRLEARGIAKEKLQDQPTEITSKFKEKHRSFKEKKKQKAAAKKKQDSVQEQ